MALTGEIKLRVTSHYLPEANTFRSAKLKMFAVIYKGDRLHDTDYYDFIEKEIDIYSVKLRKV